MLQDLEMKNTRNLVRKRPLTYGPSVLKKSSKQTNSINLKASNEKRKITLTTTMNLLPILVLLIAPIWWSNCLAKPDANGTFVPSKSFSTAHVAQKGQKENLTISSSKNINQKLNSSPNNWNQTKINQREQIKAPTLSHAQQIRNVNSSGTTNSSRKDHQTAASLLRPLILRGLIGSRRPDGSSEGGEQAEEEEEVTKTIMMPMTEQTEVPSSSQTATAASEEEESGSRSSGGSGKVKELSDTASDSDDQILAKSLRAIQSSSSKLHHDELPKADESLQLTSTEISNLLNDREAPGFFRERERNGDGVLIREEQPRLTPAASGGFGSHHGPFGGGFDGDSYAHHRLTHAASEGYDRGFNHRFGSAHGFDDVGHGRLMQSPNEYNEYYNHGPMGGSYESGRGYGYGHGHGAHDYSGHSGLLRAGSGDYGHDHGHSAGYDGYGAPDSHGPAGGYFGHGHGRLEQHSSELYPGHGYGSGHYDHLGGLYGGGRLLSAGSHHPGGYSSGHFDEYSSRFGHAGSGFDQRGFATQNNGVMMGQNSMVTNSDRQDSVLGSGKLVPFSPVVPEPEDVSSSESIEKEASKSQQQQLQQQQQQIHEALDDDVLNSDDETGSTQSYNRASNSYNSNNEDGIGMGRGSKDSSSYGEPSLVLNVPPPSGDSSQSYRTSSQAEFSRIGSAGYLNPNPNPNRQSSSSFTNNDDDEEYEGRKSYKKSSPMEPKDQAASYDPADNPAHAGKYIID